MTSSVGQVDKHLLGCCSDLLTSLHSLRGTGTLKRVVVLATDPRLQGAAALRKLGAEARDGRSGRASSASEERVKSERSA